MKLFITTLLLASLTITTFADAPANFADRKAKKITKITEHLKKMETRKSCMSNANSLTDMQMCRVTKNQNKPFKLKKGMTFETKRTNVVNRITKRIEKVTQRKTCIQNALSVTDLKACSPHKKNKK